VISGSVIGVHIARKGVILACAVLAIAREDAPGPWCARSSPWGPTRSPRAARRLWSAWGMGFPPWGFPWTSFASAA